MQIHISTLTQSCIEDDTIFCDSRKYSCISFPSARTAGIIILLLISLKYITGDCFSPKNNGCWNIFETRSFFPWSCSGVPLHLSTGWTLHYAHHRWWYGLCWSFALAGAFPLVKKQLSRKDTLKQALAMVLFVASVSGDSISSFFVLCFALLFVHITVSAPQETFCRICCLVIVTFMEISLNFKRTKHLSLVTGFQLMNSSEKVD